MTHVNRPAPPVVVPVSSCARALTSTLAHVTYPYLLGGAVGYLALTVVSRDIALMFVGALLVLYGSALSKALQGSAAKRGADGT